MGANFEFNCSSCDYTVEVSGDRDYGFVGATTTVVCEKCQELSDVEIGRSQDPDDKLNNRAQNLICRRCKQPVKEWKHPGPCPKCGAEMTRGEVTVYWD